MQYQDVLEFWFAPQEPDVFQYRPQWFVKNKNFDDEIRSKFLSLHQELRNGRHQYWLDHAEGVLATVVVLDQFSRNMFRDQPESFAGDAQALHLTKKAILDETDLKLHPVQRWFLYLPLEHSENIRDQDISVEIFADLQALIPGSNILEYAERHHDVIARFGRFPHRNRILGRESTPEEIEFLKQPGSSF